MAGVRRLREHVSAQRSLNSIQGTRISSADEDDSRPLSPDKQLRKQSGPVKVDTRDAGLNQSSTGLGGGCTAGPQLQGHPKERTLRSSRSGTVFKQAVAKAAGSPPKARPPSVRQRSHGKAAPPVTQAALLAVTGSGPKPCGPNSRHTAITAASASADVPPGQRQLQGPCCPQPSATHAIDSSVQQASRESSCSSFIGPDDQLLLSAAIDSLHRQHHTRHPCFGSAAPTRSAGSACSSGSFGSRVSSSSSSDMHNTSSNSVTALCCASVREMALPSMHQQQQAAVSVPPLPGSAQVEPQLLQGCHARTSSDACMPAATSATAAVAAALNRGAVGALEQYKQHREKQQQQQRDQLSKTERLQEQRQLQLDHSQGSAVPPIHGCMPVPATQGHQPSTLDEPSQRSASSSRALPSCLLESPASSLSPSEFEEVSREVAARIIQMHWHMYKHRRQQQQQEQQEQQHQLDPVQANVSRHRHLQEPPQCCPPLQGLQQEQLLQQLGAGSAIGQYVQHQRVGGLESLQTLEHQLPAPVQLPEKCTMQEEGSGRQWLQGLQKQQYMHITGPTAADSNCNPAAGCLQQQTQCLPAADSECSQQGTTSCLDSDPGTCKDQLAQANNKRSEQAEGKPQQYMLLRQVQQQLQQHGQQHLQQHEQHEQLGQQYRDKEGQQEDNQSCMETSADDVSNAGAAAVVSSTAPTQEASPAPAAVPTPAAIMAAAAPDEHACPDTSLLDEPAVAPVVRLSRATAERGNQLKLQQIKTDTAADQQQAAANTIPGMHWEAAGRKKDAAMASNAAPAGVTAPRTNADMAAAAADTSVCGTSCSAEDEMPRGVLAADKLGTILAYLDAVEAEAEQEAATAAAALPGHGGLGGRPGTSCFLPATAASASKAFRPMSAQVQPSRNDQTPTQPLLQQYRQQDQQPQQPHMLLWDGAVLKQEMMPQPSACSIGMTTGGLRATNLGTAALHHEPSTALSVASGGMLSTGAAAASVNSSRSAALAENVFDGVRAKMNHLKAALAAKEGALQTLMQDMETMQASHQQQLHHMAAVQQQQLSSAAAEASASLSRHLALIDRVMEDKAQLDTKLEEAHQAARASEEHHASAVAAMKQGWAAELKRQAASWEAAAAAKQEAWRAAKVAEIKEQTVKGLEVEVQRLINRHKADLAAAQDKAAEQVKAAVEAARVEHEAQLKALKDRMRQDCDEMLERERASAAARLRDSCERWEAQAQAARLRLTADTDIKLEAAVAATREEKRKGEAALEAAALKHAAKEDQLKQEWAREKEALDRAHQRALEAAKQAAADERSAWRAAVTEKLKRQAADREDKLRAELLKQRDEELEVVIRRLEAEGAAARAAAEDKVAAEHAASINSLKDQLQLAQKAAKRLAERHKATAAAAATAERQKTELVRQLEDARQEVISQQQVLSTTKAALAAKESEASTSAANATAAVASSLQGLSADKARLEGRLQELQEQIRQQRQKHEMEIQHVDLRVKAAVARKDEAIQQLQQQLAAALAALKGTEAVLAAQQEELCC